MAAASAAAAASSAEMDRRELLAAGLSQETSPPGPFQYHTFRELDQCADQPGGRPTSAFSRPARVAWACKMTPATSTGAGSRATLDEMLRALARCSALASCGLAPRPPAPSVALRRAELGNVAADCTGACARLTVDEAVPDCSDVASPPSNGGARKDAPDAMRPSAPFCPPKGVLLLAAETCAEESGFRASTDADGEGEIGGERAAAASRPRRRRRDSMKKAAAAAATTATAATAPPTAAPESPPTLPAPALTPVPLVSEREALGLTGGLAPGELADSEDEALEEAPTEDWTDAVAV